MSAHYLVDSVRFLREWASDIRRNSSSNSLDAQQIDAAASEIQSLRAQVSDLHYQLQAARSSVRECEKIWRQWNSERPDRPIRKTKALASAVVALGFEEAAGVAEVKKSVEQLSSL